MVRRTPDLPRAQRARLSSLAAAKASSTQQMIEENTSARDRVPAGDGQGREAEFR